MASQVTLYEFTKDNFKDTSSDLEDSLAEVEKNLLGLVSSEQSEVLAKHNRFFPTSAKLSSKSALICLNFSFDKYQMIVGEPNTK